METSPPLEAKRRAVQEKREELQSRLSRLREQQNTSGNEQQNGPDAPNIEPYSLILVDPQGTTWVISTGTLPRAPFEVGDHIWKWCDLPGLAEAYQHHAIVLDLWIDSSDGGPRRWIMKVADFSLWAQRQQSPSGRILTRLSSLWRQPSATTTTSSSSDSDEEQNTTVEYGLRAYNIPANDPVWSKVEYDTESGEEPIDTSETSNNPSVRSTVAQCDEVPLVLERVMFLLNFPELVPSYDLLENNCETTAVWCKTGTFASLQVMTGLTQFAGQHQQILWSAAQQSLRTQWSGLWSALPHSAAAGMASSGGAATQSTSFGTISAGNSSLWTLYGLTAVVLPKVLLWHTQRKWQALTEDLNTVFWELTTDVESDVNSGHSIELMEETTDAALCSHS